MEPGVISLLNSLRSARVLIQGASIDQACGDLMCMQNQRLGQSRPYRLALSQSMDNLHQSRAAPAYTRLIYTAGGHCVPMLNLLRSLARRHNMCRLRLGLLAGGNVDPDDISLDVFFGVHGVFIQVI